MQVVPPDSLQVGVSYRIHPNENPDHTQDFLGTFERQLLFSLDTPPSIVAQFNHVCVPIYYAAYNADGTFPHQCMPAGYRINADHATHTFYVDSANMAVRSIISAKTGSLVLNPEITKFFGKTKRKRRTNRSKRKKMRR
jgi:hypothetical protein